MVGIQTLDNARTKDDIERWLDVFVGKDELPMKEKLLENFIEKKNGKKPKTYGPNKNGYFYACKPDNSKRKIYGKTRKELLEKMSLYYTEEQEEKKRPRTFAQMWEEWTVYRRKCVKTETTNGLSPLTLTRQQADYNRLIAGSKLDKMRLNKINTAFLNDFFMEIIEEYHLQKKAFTNLFGYVNDMFERAIDSGYLEVNPCARVNKKILRMKCTVPKQKTDEERILTSEQVEALRKFILAQEEKKPTDMINYAIELAMCTGLRLGELAALKRGDIRDNVLYVDHSEHVDRSKGQRTEYYIAEPKNQRRRKIPMTANMWKVIDKIDAVSSPSEDDFLFRDLKTGQKKTYAAMARAITKRGERAGIEKLSTHRIRRTVCSMWIEKGISPLIVADWLGHTPEVDAKHYQYNTLSLDEQRDILESSDKKILLYQKAV